jgi:hypothetical protein
MKSAGCGLSAFLFLAGCAQPQLTFDRSPPQDMFTYQGDIGRPLNAQADLANLASEDLSSSAADLSVAEDLAPQCLPTGAPCTFLGRGACCSHFCVDATSLCK